ncbi:hypothetical protein PJL69_18150, partial [Shimia sp. MMG029]|nr:hypothetical protein [Shimia sp. MMG029]
IIASGKRELKRLEKEIEAILERIMSASNDTIIHRYETKVETLERQKALMMENLGKQAQSKGSIEEKLEPALTFLSNPWKIWENGTVKARRLVLKLAFTTPIRYCPKQGARTADLALPFKVLEGKSNGQFFNGARGRNRTTDTRIFNPLLKQKFHLHSRKGSVKPHSQCQLFNDGLSNLNPEVGT